MLSSGEIVTFVTAKKKKKEKDKIQDYLFFKILLIKFFIFTVLGAEQNLL